MNQISTPHKEEHIIADTDDVKHGSAFSPEERKSTGQMANKVRSEIEQMLSDKFESVKKAAKEAQFKIEKVDVTEPGKFRPK